MELALPRRAVASASMAVLFSGALGALLGPLLGLRCPWRSMGLACPGCGCTRAAVTFLTEGPIAAFRSQPTATLLLLTFASGVAIALLPEGSRWARWSGPAVAVAVLVTGAANLMFQLRSI